MKKDIHFPSWMMTLAGGLLTVSGILMAVLGRLAIGGIFWAASCLFFSAYHLRLAENRKEKEEESK